MAGLGLFLAGGLLEGVGKGMQMRGQELREERLKELDYQRRQVERAEDRTFQLQRDENAATREAARDERTAARETARDERTATREDERDARRAEREANDPLRRAQADYYGALAKDGGKGGHSAERDRAAIYQELVTQADAGNATAQRVLDLLSNAKSNPDDRAKGIVELMKTITSKYDENGKFEREYTELEKERVATEMWDRLSGRGGTPTPKPGAAPKPGPAAPAGGGPASPPPDADPPPEPGARKAPDGKWYKPDPARPGNWLVLSDR